MWIGASCNCKREVLGLKWPKRPIKCLGVYLIYDYDEFIKLNYKQRLKKIEDTANRPFSNSHGWTGSSMK